MCTGIHKDNGTVHWMRIDYSCDGLSVQLGENEEDIVSSVEHEMGTGVGDVHPADGWCTAEEVAGWLARGQWERDDYVLTGRDTHNCQTFTEAFRSWFIRTPS